MGGRRGSRTQRRHFSQIRENVWKRSKSAPRDAENGDDDGAGKVDLSWQPFPAQNPAFDKYYKAQGIVSAEEWDTFIDYLRKPLPAAFRINSSGQFCTDIRSQLENDFMRSLQSEVIEEGELVPLRSLARFHEFLKLENEIGNISRQEAVSMVPPLFLDVHSDHFVLNNAEAENSSIAIGCWRGRASLSVMVTAIDCQELLERLLACTELKNEVGAHEEKPLNDFDLGNNDEKQEEQEDDTSIAADG